MKCEICSADLVFTREYSYEIYSTPVIVKEYRCPVHKDSGINDAFMFPVKPIERLNYDTVIIDKSINFD